MVAADGSRMFRLKIVGTQPELRSSYIHLRKVIGVSRQNARFAMFGACMAEPQLGSAEVRVMRHDG